MLKISTEEALAVRLQISMKVGKSKLEESIILSNDINDNLNIFVSTTENCAALMFFSN